MIILIAAIVGIGLVFFNTVRRSKHSLERCIARGESRDHQEIRHNRVKWAWIQLYCYVFMTPLISVTVFCFWSMVAARNPYNGVLTLLLLMIGLSVFLVIQTYKEIFELKNRYKLYQLRGKLSNRTRNDLRSNIRGTRVKLWFLVLAMLVPSVYFTFLQWRYSPISTPPIPLLW